MLLLEALLLLLLLPLLLHLLLALFLLVVSLLCALFHLLLALLLLFKPALFHRLSAVILLLEPAIASHGISRLGAASLEWLPHSAPSRVLIRAAHIDSIGIVPHTISRCTNRAVITSCIRLPRGVNTPVTTRSHRAQSRITNILTACIHAVRLDLTSRTNRTNPAAAALAVFHGPHSIRSPVTTRSHRAQSRITNILTACIHAVRLDLTSRTNRTNPAAAALAVFHGPHSIRSPVTTRSHRAQSRITNILTACIHAVRLDIASRTNRTNPVTTANV